MSAADFLLGLNIQQPWFFPLLLALLGGVFGSFITCTVYRMPRNLSLRSPGSYCPECETRLGVLDLVPIFSFLLSGGKCRHCKAPVPWRYFCIELVAVLLCLAVWYVFEISVLTPLFFVWVLLALFCVSLWVLEKSFAPKVLLFFLILTCGIAYNLL